MRVRVRVSEGGRERDRVYEVMCYGAAYALDRRFTARERERARARETEREREREREVRIFYD